MSGMQASPAARRGHHAHRPAAGVGCDLSTTPLHPSLPRPRRTRRRVPLALRSPATVALTGPEHAAALRALAALLPDAPPDPRHTHRGVTRHEYRWTGQPHRQHRGFPYISRPAYRVLSSTCLTHLWWSASTRRPCTPRRYEMARADRDRQAALAVVGYCRHEYLLTRRGTVQYQRRQPLPCDTGTKCNVVPARPLSTPYPDGMSVRVPRPWLWRVGATTTMWVVAVGVAAYQETAAAFAAPSTADTQTPAVHLLGLLALVGLAVGVVQGVASPTKGILVAPATAILSASAAAFAAGAAALAQPCAGHGPCDTAAAPVAVEVWAVTAAAFLATCSVGWMLGWLATRLTNLLLRRA